MNAQSSTSHSFWSDLSLSDADTLDKASQRGKQGHRCRYLNMQNDFTVQIHGEQRPLVTTFEFTQG